VGIYITAKRNDPYEPGTVSRRQPGNEVDFRADWKEITASKMIVRDVGLEACADRWLLNLLYLI
jgi:hypothetical protein